ncbi:MAG TPA: sigma-70 family RNA polymerase sigma factor [Acidimicrobiales bacterium]
MTDDRVVQLDALYRVEYAGMVRLAYTLLGSNAEAEEIVQDSFIEVHRRWPEILKPGAYLRCAVVSRCRSALQRRKLHSPYPFEAPTVSASAGELWDVLTRLSDEQRIAVVLRYYGGYSASDIATMLEMPAATVRSHLRRGLATLKKELAE